MKLKCFALASIVSIGVISCSEDVTEPEMQKELSDYYVENGVLNIKNVEVFEDLARANSKKTLAELRDWQDSLGFYSYQTFYEDFYLEYENAVESEEPIAALEQLKVDYEGFITFPGGMIEGVPNYCMEPVIDMRYATVSNVNGLVKIDGELIDTKSIIQTKAVTLSTCDKSTSKRKMTIRPSVITNTFGVKVINYVRVWHQKKFLWGWVNYKTQYYWRFDTNAAGYYYTNGDISTDWVIWMPSGGVRYLQMWNRGVGESNSCDFDL